MVVPSFGLFAKRSPVLLTALSSLVQYALPSGDSGLHKLIKRSEDPTPEQKLVGGILIPVLVLLSGLFAGLTLGYMSLDETQLHVLSVSGTPQQQRNAKKIIPVRKNGHLLLVTLLLANMIANETLPVIADPVLGGGFQAVVVSTALIVIFAEIIPQSICTRYGLSVGATMAPLMWVLLFTFGIVAWPVAKLLELALGPHHGIIYRRAELKELVALHATATAGTHGGDLLQDTANIIGATLDLQEKMASQAMTPISEVFMLHIDAKLDYATLRTVCAKGHSRVPIYDDIVLPGGQKAQKIVGVLLVKQCVLLDPDDAVPVRSLPLNRLPTVAQNAPLLGILDRFQQGHSHMAIVSRLTIDKAASVKHTVKKNLGQRIRDRVGLTDSSGSDSDSDSESEDGSGSPRKRRFRFGRRNSREKDAEMASTKGSTKMTEKEKTEIQPPAQPDAKKTGKFSITTSANREASMPADAVLGKDQVNKFLEGFDPSVAPLGIITLEDVLEEVIGEEIYDEFDPEGEGHGHGRIAYDGHVPTTQTEEPLKRRGSVPNLTSPAPTVLPAAPAIAEPTPALIIAPSLRKTLTAPLGFLASRSRSVPGTPRMGPSRTGTPRMPGLSMTPGPAVPATSPIPEPSTPNMGEKQLTDETAVNVPSLEGQNSDAPPIAAPEPVRPPHVEARIRAAGLTPAGAQGGSKRRFKSVRADGSDNVVAQRVRPRASDAVPDSRETDERAASSPMPEERVEDIEPDKNYEGE